MSHTILDDLGFHTLHPESMDLSDWVIDENELDKLPPDVLAKYLPPPGSPHSLFPPFEASEADPFLTPDQVAAIKIWEVMEKRRDRMRANDLVAALSTQSHLAGKAEAHHDTTVPPGGFKEIDGFWSAWMWYIHGHGLQAYLGLETLKKFIDPWYSHYKYSPLSVDDQMPIDKEIQIRVRHSRIGDHLHFRLPYTVFVHHWFSQPPFDTTWLFLGNQVRFFVDVDCDVVQSINGKPLAASPILGRSIPGGANLHLTIDKTYTFDDRWNSEFRWFTIGTGTDYHITNSWDDTISVGE